MSLLPMTPSNLAARAASPTRVSRAERAPEIERAESLEQTDRASRAHTPPDFAMLLALLAGNSATLTARDAIDPDSLLQTANANATVSDSDAETLSESDNQTPNDTSTAGARSSGGAPFADSDQRALARSMRADALRIAQAVMADTNSGAAFTGNASGMRTMQSPAEVSDSDMFSLAERARGNGFGELLARGDAQAAGLRSRIDAMLDIAGTPRGRAMAEATRPAFAAAVTRSAADVTVAVRDTDALAPDFKGRLDRVIDRMRDEFGHDVQVVETVRSSERQEHLFAQGRTRSGPVVTWTTESAHLSGEAADVMIDGKWHNPQGYARLHEVANEEGLRTLGMRDPGHLEMPGASRGALSTVGSVRDNVAPNGVAQVAAVASVAQVAAVAQVARPGTSGVRSGNSSINANARSSQGSAATTGVATAESTPALLGGTQAAGGSLARGQSQSQHNTSDQSTRDKRLDTLTETERSVVSAGDRANERSASGGEGLSAIGSLGASVERVLDGGVPRVTAPVGSNASTRAEAIAVLREDAPARSINSLTMLVDSPTGAEEIRVSLRGGTVGAQINTTDQALADRLRLQTADLADALTRHGLENEPLRVQQSARAQDIDATRQALAERGDLLKANGASAGQQTGQQTAQQHQQEPGSRERSATRQQPERDTPKHDAREDTHQQGRRHDRQENR